jgi:hypothetical protein
MGCAAAVIGEPFRPGGWVSSRGMLPKIPFPAKTRWLCGIGLSPAVRPAVPLVPLFWEGDSYSEVPFGSFLGADGRSQ